jgi:hypothetical protein
MGDSKKNCDKAATDLKLRQTRRKNIYVALGKLQFIKVTTMHSDRLLYRISS